ncbi:RNA polymerase sigma factor [Enhygromyxa salina]|uniref:RNA polymerase sigma factor n=1 Tax=Enhygromyxa salina TaxID=215803 RepID=A0A2S9Y2L5_9BACT|nr:RNA polymerase sigma factor [Enhygromyxa salina]PRP99352.1 RNA polymerase sigma factor [Enhygromyxa salina]
MSWQISASTATVQRLNTELLKFFYARVKQTQDAEDLASTTWLGAGRNFKHLSSLRHFLFSVAYIVLADHRRKAGRRPITEPADFNALPAVFVELDSLLDRLTTRADQKAHAERAAALLPEAYRDVVLLALDGRKNGEIALTLQLNGNTVRSRLSRGLALLRPLLDVDG